MVDLDIFRLLGLIVFKALFDKSKVPSSLAILASCALKWSRSGLLDTPSKADIDATEFDRTVAGVYANQLKGAFLDVVSSFPTIFVSTHTLKISFSERTGSAGYLSEGAEGRVFDSLVRPRGA